MLSVSCLKGSESRARGATNNSYKSYDKWEWDAYACFPRGQVDGSATQTWGLIPNGDTRYDFFLKSHSTRSVLFGGFCMSGNSILNRRHFCASVAAAAAAYPLGLAAQPVSGDATVRPFQASFSDADLDDLRRRIKATKWPDRE